MTPAEADSLVVDTTDGVTTLRLQRPHRRNSLDHDLLRRLVVAAEDAYFRAPFADRGLTADGGTAHHLPRRLGPQRAARHLLLGERLDATAAHDAGIVSQLVPAGSATERATAAAHRLAAGPRESNALTKRLAAAAHADLGDFLATERMAVSLAGHGADSAEGRAAFAEKRPPRFG